MRVELFFAFCLLLPSLEASPRRLVGGKTDMFDDIFDQPGGEVDLAVPVLRVQAGVDLGGDRHRPPHHHRLVGLAKDHPPLTQGRPWAPHLPTPGRQWEAELEVLLEVL